jgi:hypothetical protein
MRQRGCFSARGNGLLIRALMRHRMGLSIFVMLELHSVAHSPRPFRRWLALAAAASSALVLASASEARARCKYGQIYRPSLGVCQSKSARGAQPYLKKAARLTPAVRRAPATEPPRQEQSDSRNNSEPLSTMPILEPKAQGSLNPLPRWKSGL